MYLNSELRTVHINKVLICAIPAQQQKPEKNVSHTNKYVWECYCYVAEDLFAYIYTVIWTAADMSTTLSCVLAIMEWIKVKMWNIYLHMMFCGSHKKWCQCTLNTATIVLPLTNTSTRSTIFLLSQSVKQACPDLNTTDIWCCVVPIKPL